MKKYGILIAAMLFGTHCLVAGDVTGKVTFKGKPSAGTRLRMDADKYCKTVHKEAVFSEDVVVNKNGTLKNVLVYVKDGLSGKKFDALKTKAVFDQQGCVYVPHVMGLQTGQEVEILNSDPTLHNVHTLSSANPSFNAAQPVKGMKFTKKFEKVESFRVKCDVHPWMSAYLGVFSHPFFAVTNGDGSFTIKGLPAGEYTLEAWHEKYGTQTMKVSVGASDKKTVDFSYAAK